MNTHSIPQRLLLAAGLLTLASCSDSTEPTAGATQGAVRVTATTTGTDLPSGGYNVSVDSGAGQAVAANGAVTISGLSASRHSVPLYGVAANCALRGVNTRSVDVTAGDTVVVAFDVVCTTPSGANGQLAFASNRDGNYEIYVTNADGSSPTRLTNSAATDVQPAWSPDGTKLAFASNRDGNFEIYVMGAVGLDPTRLTNELADDYDPAWAPDGKKIAFTSERDGHPEVYGMEIDGSSPVRLTDQAGANEAPTWSPDGTRIAFVSHRDGNGRIYAMNADGSHVIRLTGDAAEDCEPAWSPDGGHIAFVSGCTSDLFPTTSSHIYLINADGSNPVQVTGDVFPEQARFPSWSPDGMAITFAGTTACRSSDADGCYWWWPYEIKVVRVDGTLPASVPGSGDNYSDVDPSWS